MFINPEKLSIPERKRVVRWLEANGCRHYVAVEPVVVKGNRAYYTALCRQDAKSVRRMTIRDNRVIPLGERSVHIRIPLSAIA